MHNLSWIKPITLEGQYVTLIPLSTNHSDALIEAVKDGELWNLWYTLVPSPQDMAGEIQRRLVLQSEGSMLPFTVMDRNTECVLGMTTYTDVMAIYNQATVINACV